jgi:formylglycine-generating enzyme required for sulfatase activity
MFNRKGISPVVATTLLLVVAVLSVVGFMSWFESFQSSNLVDVERQSSSGKIYTSVDQFIGDTLYIKNGYDNLSISDISVDGISCGINISSTDNLIKISLAGNSCINFTSSTPDFVVYTKEGVFSKKEYIKSVDTILGGGGGGGSPPSLDCSTIPYGDWILVPGNPTLGTSDFCVMKYEAKATTSSLPNLFDSINMYCGDGTDGGGNNCLTDGSVNVTSKAASKPLTQVYQTEARQLCANLGANYQLITDAQWVTIARNAENVSSNWADNTIGSQVASGGGLKRGNVGIDDSASYNATSDPTDRSLDTNSKAMFTLQNGETIWDISGNVWEWTNDTFNTNAESALGQGTSNWYEWTAISGHDSLEPFSSSLDANYGVGRVHVDVDDAYPSGTVHGFLRGGDWDDGAIAGAFALYLHNGPSFSGTRFGFRCTYTP